MTKKTQDAPVAEVPVIKAPESPASEVSADQATHTPEEAAVAAETPAKLQEEPKFKSLPEKPAKDQPSERAVRFVRMPLGSANPSLRTNSPDMPTDKYGVTSGLRRAFKEAVSRAKGSDEKMQVLHETVKVLVKGMMEEKAKKRPAKLGKVKRSK